MNLIIKRKGIVKMKKNKLPIALGIASVCLAVVAIVAFLILGNRTESPDRTLVSSP